MIVVFGASGNTGGAASRSLLARGESVRAVGRSRERLSALAELGAEVVEADLQNASDVRRALGGADAAYLIIPPNMGAPDFRAYQGTVARSLVEGLEGSDCQSVVLLSSMGAEHEAGTGPIVGLHRLEKSLASIKDTGVLSLRAGYFMENFFMNLQMIEAQGILAAPAPAEAPLTLIAAPDIGAYAADRLAARDFSGFEVVNLFGPRLVTFAEVTAMLGKAVGKPDLRFVQTSYEDAAQGMLRAGVSQQLVGMYIEMYQGAAKGLLAPEPGTPVVNTTTTFEQFAERFAAAARG
jgi:uncharacterized protein YbjT (DUF2867 family)